MLSFDNNLATRSFIFGCIGLAAEVGFVALTALLFENDASLRGHSYMWVMPLYAMIPYAAPYFRECTRDMTYMVKYNVAAGAFVIVETIAGFILYLVVGQCPWEYSSGIHMFGLTRLDYWPLWFCFAAFVDHLDLTVQIEHRCTVTKYVYSNSDDDNGGDKTVEELRRSAFNRRPDINPTLSFKRAALRSFEQQDTTMSSPKPFKMPSDDNIAIPPLPGLVERGSYHRTPFNSPSSTHDDSFPVLKHAK